MNNVRASLIDLSHQLGLEERCLTILAEGNTSGKIGRNSFLVKASGCRLATLKSNDLVECQISPLLALLDAEKANDSTIAQAFLEAKVDKNESRPSIEALFHAWLLSFEENYFVGHSHPTAVNRILCSNKARDFASKILFPDQAVCCGPEAVLVPYADPGLPLAKEIRAGVLKFRAKYKQPPRVILLKNHGLIAAGPSVESVLAATLMTVKAAEIFMGACAIGSPRFLTANAAQRIWKRPDEAYRQRKLKL